MKALIIPLWLLVTNLCSQSWVPYDTVPGFITDIEIHNGERYITFKTGELLQGDSIINTYPVQLYQETGLLSVCWWQDSTCVMVCSNDSTQRIICGTDTLFEVSYKSPWAIRHRGGDMVATDTVLYASFGYGADPDDAQDTTNFRGKIVAITSDTTYVVAYGLRNGWKIDLAGDTLFVADVGAQGAEEINRISLDSVNLQEPVNLGWPCEEGPIVHDTICGPVEGPFFTYPRAQTGNAIIGGKCFQDAFWWCDNFYRFGGYVYDDTTWIKTTCPQYPDGMYVQGDSIFVYDYTGKIYLWVESPLSIDSIPEKEKPVPPPDLVITPYEIRWNEPLPGTLMVLTIEGDIVAYEDAEFRGSISLDGYIPGMYALVLIGRHGLQWSKLFVVI